MTRRRQYAGALVALAALAGFAVPANAQHVAAELPSSLSLATRAAVIALADSMANDGLPSDVLVAKAAEGVLKGADETRILAAVRSLAGRLREARRVVGPYAQNAELIAAERLATVGKMAAHVAHEIRNPLSSLALNLDLLEEEIGPANPEAIALHRAVRTEVERLTALSERYLSVARKKPPRLDEEDVAGVCTEAFQAMRPDLERHGVAGKLDLEPDLPAVRVDEGLLRQALDNLLRNAREATPTRGTVTLGARRTEEGGVEIRVDDEGPGIAPELRERLFEPFFTTKNHGTGLGLVITREIVESHGGAVDCAPLRPVGTRFSIRLPPAPG